MVKLGFVPVSTPDSLACVDVQFIVFFFGFLDLIWFHTRRECRWHLIIAYYRTIRVPCFFIIVDEIVNFSPSR